MEKKMGTICRFQNTRFWPMESTYQAHIQKGSRAFI